MHAIFRYRSSPCHYSRSYSLSPKADSADAFARKHFSLQPAAVAEIPFTAKESCSKELQGQFSPFCQLVTPERPKPEEARPGESFYNADGCN